MAALIKYVDTAAVGTDSGDDWTNAYPRIFDLGTYLDTKDLVTDGDNLTVYFRGGEDASNMTNSLTARNIMSDATNFCKFVADGTNGSDQLSSTSVDVSKYHIKYASNCIILGSGYLVVDGLQLESIGTLNFRHCAVVAGGGELHILNCVLKESGTTLSDRTAARVEGNNSGILIIKNSIIDGPFGKGIIWGLSSGTGSIIATNNTIVNAANGFWNNFQDILAYNNVLANVSPDWGTGQFDSLTDYQAYENSTPPPNGTNTNDVGNAPIALANLAGGDYRLNATDTALQTAGLGANANADILSYDFFRNPRDGDNPSMGACEYAAVAQTFKRLAILKTNSPGVRIL